MAEPNTALKPPSAAPGMLSAMARAIAPRKPITVSQWADIERRLSSKGSAHAGQWRTDANPPLREPMDCMSARSGVREVVLMFPIQFGKALALDTPLPTPSGWTSIADVQTGDWVLGDDGIPARVIAVSGIFTGHDCYRITFSDGASVIADAGHRWSVIDLRARSEARREFRRRAALEDRGGIPRRRAEISAATADHACILTSQELASSFRSPRGQSRYGVLHAAPIELPDADLPVTPYLLGIWLADGSSAAANLSLNEDDAPHILSRITAFGNTVKAWKRAEDIARESRCITAIPDPRENGKQTFYRRLKSIGLIGAKHIPQAYLRASREQRMQLLQGLMDSDGYGSPRGFAEITSSIPRLAEDIAELLRTLGFRPSVKWRKTRCQDSCRITFAAYVASDVFSLPRKRDKLPLAPSCRGEAAVSMRYITNVEKMPSVPTKCIAVDNKSHLYLCGREFIPTHNTEVAVNALGYCMDHDPGPVMVCLPGEVSMQKWVAQKLHPAIEETPAMRRALTSVVSRDAANTRTFKDFAGGQLYIEHAGSPSRLKSTSVRTLIVDEVDEFSNNLSGGDDPLEMLNGRTSAFPATYRRLYISTPQIKGVSRIESLWNKSDQRRYFVPCPHCGHMQHLEWSGLHWSPGGAQVWYVCRDCGAHIDEHHKTDMIRRGEWRATNPDAKGRNVPRGYHINALYYQFGLGPRWADLVDMWLDAQNDPARLKTFVNDRLAEPWEDPSMRAVRHNAIADRAEAYPLRTAPAGVRAITVGVDTQDNRLAVHIVGWGRSMACWTLDYVELPGDPAEDAVWVSLTELLNRPIQHASGATLRAEAVAIDAGGHRTEAVKHYVRERRVRRPMAIFGAIPNNAPILSKGKLQDVDWRGRSDKRGVMIHHVGTVGAKHWLYSRLSADASKDPDERLTHFSEELPREFFTGLVGEVYNPAKNRFENRRGARNEPLDTWVYAYAAAHHPELRLHRATKADWDRREAALQAHTGAKSAPDVAPEPAPEPAPAAPAATPFVPRQRAGYSARNW